MIKIQCTLFSDKGYKPMSTIIQRESVSDYNRNKKEVQQEAINKICCQRYMNKHNLKEYGYTKMKIRKYDK